MLSYSLRRSLSSTFALVLALTLIGVVRQWLIPATSASAKANFITVSPGESIQAAIDAATAGDTIVINPGIYTESLTLNKAVSLTGVSSTTVVINAMSNQRVLTVTGNAVNNSVVISGFVLANGDVSGGSTCPVFCGGGVLITATAQPRIQNLLIANNHAGWSGGGLYAHGSLTLTGLALVNNTSQRRGGGAYIENTAIVNASSFVQNTCTATNVECIGGGLMAGLAPGSDLIINNSQFISNTVIAGSFWGLGGGVYGGKVTVANSVFENNRCTNNNCTGGGLYAFYALVADRISVAHNSATYGGSGVYSVGGATVISSRFEHNQGHGLYSDGVVTATNATFIDNLNVGLAAKSVLAVGGRFESNQSGGLRANTLFLTGTLFADNTGSAISLNNFGTPGSSRVANALFVGNGGYGAALYLNSPSSRLDVLHSTIAANTLVDSTAIVVNQGTLGLTNTIVSSYSVGIERVGGYFYEDYNLFYSNTTNISGAFDGGLHDVFDNPNFANPALSDYHIISPSAAIDAGVNAGVTTDHDGLPRPVGAGYDIGAYEYINFTSHVFLPLVRK